MSQAKARRYMYTTEDQHTNSQSMPFQLMDGCAGPQVGNNKHIQTKR